MIRTKIGFIPSNWEDWNGENWAPAMRDRCVKALEQIPGMDLVVPGHDLTQHGCLNDLEDVPKVLDLFKRENIQGLIIGNMTFGMEVAVGTLLAQLPKDMPILHFATKSGPINEKGERSTDTWCGQFMTVSAIKRRGFRYIHIHTCNPEDDYFKQKMETFSRAMAALSRFKGARLGQLGTRPTLFESQAWNEQLMQKQFGQMVVTMDLDTVFDHIDQISPDDPQVLALADEIIQGVNVVENRPNSIINQARYELALKEIARELNLQAMAVNCWTRIQKRYEISACSTYARLNEQGIITACEVDLLGGATMLAMHNAALTETRPDFIDWTDLHPSEPNTWLAWHCGNAAPSLCASGCPKTLTRNLRMIQWCETCHGALEFELKPGPVTCSRLVEYDGEYTFFFGTGEVVHLDPAIRGAYGWVKVKDVFDWEQKMCEHGIIHHGTLIHDPKVADALEMFCYFGGIKPVRGA